MYDGYNFHTIDGVNFPNYGSHHDEYEIPYLTAACAVGSTREELTTFVQRLVRLTKKNPMET